MGSDKRTTTWSDGADLPEAGQPGSGGLADCLGLNPLLKQAHLQPSLHHGQSQHQGGQQQVGAPRPGRKSERQ